MSKYLGSSMRPRVVGPVRSVIAVYQEASRTALGMELESGTRLSAPGSLPPVVATALLDLTDPPGKPRLNSSADVLSCCVLSSDVVFNSTASVYELVGASRGVANVGRNGQLGLCWCGRQTLVTER